MSTGYITSKHPGLPNNGITNVKLMQFDMPVIIDLKNNPLLPLYDVLKAISEHSKATRFPKPYFVDFRDNSLGLIGSVATEPGEDKIGINPKDPLYLNGNVVVRVSNSEYILVSGKNVIRHTQFGIHYCIWEYPIATEFVKDTAALQEYIDNKDSHLFKQHLSCHNGSSYTLDAAITEAFKMSGKKPTSKEAKIIAEARKANLALEGLKKLWLST